MPLSVVVLPVPGPFLDVSVIYRGQVDGTVDLNDPNTAVKPPLNRR